MAYDFEHRGHFQRDGVFQYLPYQDYEGKLQAIPSATHCKKPILAHSHLMSKTNIELLLLAIRILPFMVALSKR